MIDMSAYTPTQEELAFLGEQAGYEVTVEDGDLIEPPQVKGIRIPDTQGIIEELSKTIIVEGPEAYVDYINANLSRVREAAAFDEKVVEVLVTGYKMGVAQKHGPCANNLGALYYSGEFVEQDYEKAAELYELAMDWGCYQSTVNLGYIYEYGRIGEPDYEKAYMYYSLAAAYDQHYEALYKLGDMFSRGKPFGKDLKKAYRLWRKSYEVAYGLEEESQAAVRIAPLLLDEANGQYGIPYDPLQALHLYQIAEVGLRISIDKGLDYYRKRLAQAIEGQEKAREALEAWPDLR